MATTTNNGWTTPDDTAYVSQGAAAIRTLGSAIDTSTGTGLKAWQTYVPTISGGFTKGNGTFIAKYAQLGKNVHVLVKYTTGTTSTSGSNLLISLPVTAAQTFNLGNVSMVIMGTSYDGIIRNETTTTGRILCKGASGNYVTQTQVTTAVPSATGWLDGDTVTFSLTYEAA